MANLIIGISFNVPRRVLTGLLTLVLGGGVLAAEDEAGTRLAPPSGLKVVTPLPPPTGLQARAPLPPPAELEGWTSIMPAADLKGWTRIAIPPTNALGRPQWHLDTSRQVLVCDGDGGHEMLRFDQELTNCAFHVECRFVPASGPKTNFNSGIFIRNSADGTIWHQCQLTRDGGYLFGDTPAGEQIRPFKSPASERRMKPAGEWNTVEVSAQGRILTVWFNGAEVSKFNACDMPSGYIALEAEGYGIEFRNLKLKQLP